MLEISVPGKKTYKFEFLVLDFNGTIAVDGKIPDKIKSLLTKIKNDLTIIVLTADTYGSASSQCEALGLQVKTFPQDCAAAEKQKIVENLGKNSVICMGNGFNDIKMFDSADLSIAVLDAEGLCASLLTHADILCRSSEEALNLLLNPKRIIADLRG